MSFCWFCHEAAHFQEHLNELEMMKNEIAYNTEESEQLLKEGDKSLEDALEDTRVCQIKLFVPQ